MVITTFVKIFWRNFYGSFIQKNTALFRGMSEKEASAALDALQADERSFNKGALILHAGETTDRMGLVLDGSVTAKKITTGSAGGFTLALQGPFTC